MEVFKTKEINAYLDLQPADKKETLMRLMDLFDSHLPLGFAKTYQYKMITYVVPLETYPKGYLNDSKTPLPFISIAAQKNHLAIYHMGLYGQAELYDWFISEYRKHTDLRLDMGKSCIRFKNLKKIPYELIKELATKMSVSDFILIAEKRFKK